MCLDTQIDDNPKSESTLILILLVLLPQLF